ncbi:MAG TPA: ROK family protein, partial [Acidimicrobiales bacterium]
MTNSANTSSSTATPSPKAHPRHPFTLAIDIGGTGLKASVLDADGAMVADRVKIPTTYPLSPEKLMADLSKLVAPLPDAERASVGFPGMVRAGRVLSAPHFQTKHGPGSH